MVVCITGSVHSELSMNNMHHLIQNEPDHHEGTDGKDDQFEVRPSRQVSLQSSGAGRVTSVRPNSRERLTEWGDPKVLIPEIAPVYLSRAA